VDIKEIFNNIRKLNIWSKERWRKGIGLRCLVVGPGKMLAGNRHNKLNGLKMIQYNLTQLLKIM